jgi:hypothetical protein
MVIIEYLFKADQVFLCYISYASRDNKDRNIIKDKVKSGFFTENFYTPIGHEKEKIIFSTK